MVTRGILGLSLIFFGFVAIAQPDRWQQRVAYKMEIDMDAESNQFSGTQELTYYNNSPDTLFKVYYHLYFNAFQPGSMMDVRSRTISDPDKRVGDRIYHLGADEIGYHKINSLFQDGKPVDYSIDGTVMTVQLVAPIMPNTSVVFRMKFESQVPLQVRRSGRDNKEGIRLSMAQWYPKLAEYDYSGWHAYDYVGREFYSPWGDFDVSIKIDNEYVVAATGLLKEEINRKKKTTYRYAAENVHDFVWAADPDYVRKVVNVRDGLDFEFYYQTDTLADRWVEMEDYIKKAVPFIEERCGTYPYPVYKVIQGGDGGMEYPMATLITGHRSLKSLVGVTIHEFLHSWYQMVLGTNESLYYWMDEGFNTYYDNLTMDYLFNEKYPSKDFMKSSYKYYNQIVTSGLEEPMTTHADHFETNKAYSMASYRKGGLTLQNLSYLVGSEAFDAAMLRYYNTWKFKHPNATDFEVIMEKESGLELSWFFNYWIQSAKTIDYAVADVSMESKGTSIALTRKGYIPMPLDVLVTLKGGEQLSYHIPLGMTRGHRPLAKGEILMTEWKWVNPYYSFIIDVAKDQIESVEIDPSQRMTDLDFQNNKYPNSNNEVEIQGKPEKLENN
ncbi:M1 family metallopeptidase [Reichenbachiella carrageenanivorans]|uniref:M1 family metallopeptidase n=1 Tax=Reichenbachiella carrageenanivorans TaxID=2979869 RepID=A0ABY6D083_9BACT|nr:M1 family metallopeptidase [Reichenbachiella carrageenanivorans]UXX78468.1 M1 family metallopeptidase [Reichenbachiella carrageenanivorans]